MITKIISFSKNSNSESPLRQFDCPFADSEMQSYWYKEILGIPRSLNCSIHPIKGTNELRIYRGCGRSRLEYVHKYFQEIVDDLSQLSFEQFAGEENLSSLGYSKGITVDMLLDAMKSLLHNQENFRQQRTAKEKVYALYNGEIVPIEDFIRSINVVDYFSVDSIVSINDEVKNND